MERRFSVRRFLAVVTTGAVAVAVAAGEATAGLLVEDVPSRLCLGRSFTVGVWYQAHSGGPRDFSIEIYEPSGRLVLYRKRLAISTRWKVWRYRPTRIGAHRVVYSASGFGGPWAP